jgi:dienelactone hydrolase
MNHRWRIFGHTDRDGEIWPQFASTRRAWLLAATACTLLPKCRASDLSGFYYRDYSKCLPDYLAGLAQRAYEKRNAELDSLVSAEAVRQRQQWVRDTFWKLVGGEPERTPLQARITGHLDRAGYRLQKVVYESRSRVFVSANLYLPSVGKAPYPGVLFQMGHYYSGKAYASYQKCCQGLARLGFVVLAFDPMGQGERIAYPDASGINTRLGSATDEHDVPGKQLLLLGDSSTRFQVWDAIRGLDYLAAHELVDPTRLASAGQSGGATLTMLLGCVDDRLAAAAVSSGNTEDFACRNFNPPGSTDDAEQDFIGSGAVGFDRWDLLYPLAPKPLLIEVSAHDFFGTYSPRYLEDGREQYQRLLKIYALLGKPEQLAWNSTPLPHGLTYSLRLAIYNWFERWLKNSDRVIQEEPPVSPEPDAALWVGPTGNVTRDFGSLRPFDLVKQKAIDTRPTASSDWVKQLGIMQPQAQLQFQTLTTVAFSGARVSASEVNTTADVWVPAWFFIPASPNPSSSTLLVLDDRGRNHHAHEDDLYHALSRTGRYVCAADIRGIGDMSPEVGRGNPGYTIDHAKEEEFAWASLILGESLLAQRINDILALVQATKNRSETQTGALSLAARGSLTVPALFAFAACPEITVLYLAGGLLSFNSILQTENYRQPLANFAWNLYRMTDLPLLASQAAPRRIHLAGTVDAANQPVNLEEMRRAYPGANVQISREPLWNEGAFRST